MFLTENIYLTTSWMYYSVNISKWKLREWIWRRPCCGQVESVTGLFFQGPSHLESSRYLIQMIEECEWIKIFPLTILNNLQLSFSETFFFDWKYFLVDFVLHFWNFSLKVGWIQKPYIPDPIFMPSAKVIDWILIKFE